MSDRLQILLEETGQWGPFQWRLNAVSFYLIVMCCFRIAEYFFTTARIPTRCVISECEDLNVTQFSPTWLDRAVPLINGNFDNCHRYAPAINANDNATASADACPAELFDTNTIVACESYVYENHDTVVYDFGLACDEWHRSLIGAVRMAGMLVGLLLMGFASDRWGRRPTVIVNEFLVACLGIMRYWSTTYGVYMGLVFIEATIGGSQYACTYILVMETVGSKYRGIVGSIVKLYYAVGLIILTLLAWAVPNWRTLTLVLFMPQLLICCYFWMVPESIRWNISKGNYDAAEAGLKKVAQMNGKKLSEQSLRELRQAAEEERQQGKSKGNEPLLVVQVFRNRKILLRCLVAPVLWITMMMTYYGLSVNVINLFGNKYLNYSLVFAVEIPGAFLAMYLLNQTGRRIILAGAYWVCTACQLVYIFMPKGFVVASLIVYLMGKMCIVLVIVALHVYTMELFPTRYRQNLFNFSITIGKIGAIVAPLTTYFATIWAPLPFVLIASLALTSGLLVLVLPETRDTVLPDTMQQATRLTSTSRPQGAEDLGLLASRSRTQ